MLVAFVTPIIIVALIFGIPWLTFVICRCLPRWTLRLATCLILTIAPAALLHVYFTYGYTLRRTPGLRTCPQSLDGAYLLAVMAFGAFLSDVSRLGR